MGVMRNSAIQSWRKAERYLAYHWGRRTIRLSLNTGIVCFTFDDVPRSACDQGAAILAKYGAKGTFYVCGGLTGTGKYHTTEDLRHLVSDGHELGSHGFGHYGYQSHDKMEIVSDLQKNLLFFESIGCEAPRNFAYPYGQVSPFIKRIVAPKFASTRGVKPGINHPIADLALLRSYPLYEHLWTETALIRVFEENSALCGLLIFFSHGVESNPDKFDCSNRLLDFAIRASIASGNRIVSMRDALQGLVATER
jgi:peptidoglycan/xylan/chitin deacetylase (PgdA/CDA1 family)